MAASLGPLGPLRGMTFDPLRNRYFPTPKGPPPPTSQPLHRSTYSPLTSSPLASTSILSLDSDILPLPPSTNPRCLGKKPKPKRRLHPPEPEETGKPYVPRAKTGRMVSRYMRGSTSSKTQERGKMEREEWSSLAYETMFEVGCCGGEKVTSFKSFAGGAFFATTDHGKVVIHRQDGETHEIGVCSAGLMGMHCDLPRMTMLAIATGPEPHIHHFRRNPSNLDHVFMQHNELDLPGGDFFCMDSYDGTCTIGGNKSLTSIRYDQSPLTQRRNMPSDVLAIDHHDEHVVFAGLRSGIVSMEDLRVDQGGKRDKIAGTQKGKAVVGVKRLKDGAVPWGLVVSGMGDELLLFDIRFGQRPLRRFEGHVNKFHSNLGLATTPDDRFLYVAGSDNRLRLYETTTGLRIHPTSSGFSSPSSSSFENTLHPIDFSSRRIGPHAPNPLARIYGDNITHIAPRKDEWGVDVIVKGHVCRFGRGGAGSSSLAFGRREGDDGAVEMF